MSADTCTLFRVSCVFKFYILQIDVCDPLIYSLFWDQRPLLVNVYKVVKN